MKIKAIVTRPDKPLGYVTHISVSIKAIKRRFPFGFYILEPDGYSFVVLEDYRLLNEPTAAKNMYLETVIVQKPKMITFDNPAWIQNAGMDAFNIEDFERFKQTDMRFRGKIVGPCIIK